MNHRFLFMGMCLALVIGGNGRARESVALPNDVPPVLGTAMVSDPGTGIEGSEWAIRLSIPRIAWKVVGQMVPKREWPELEAEVEMSVRSLQMGGPSALSPSRVVDLKGRELERNEVMQGLREETPVLVSVSGRMPDAYYLQLTSPDTLIVILGPRDGYPAPELLPAKKESATLSEDDGDQ